MNSNYIPEYFIFNNPLYGKDVHVFVDMKLNSYGTGIFVRVQPIGAIFTKDYVNTLHFNNINEFKSMVTFINKKIANVYNKIDKIRDSL